jgi:hypothetical protein
LTGFPRMEWGARSMAVGIRDGEAGRDARYDRL